MSGANDEWKPVEPDPWAPVAPARRRGGGLINAMPGVGMALDVARGFAGAVPDIATLGGYLSGSNSLMSWGSDANKFLDRNIAPRAEFGEDTTRALLQTAGPALIPVGGQAALGTRLLSLMPQFVKNSPLLSGIAGGGARAVELALPGSSPYTPLNIAANAVVGAGASYGAEQLSNAAQEAEAKRTGFTPVTESVAPTETPWTPTNSEPKALAERFNDALPYIVGGLTVLSVAGAARLAQRQASRQIEAASVDALTAPGTPQSAVPMTGVVEGIENGLFNQHTILSNRVDEAVKQGRMTRAEADNVIGTVITHANESVNSDILREVWDTGRFPGGLATTPPKDVAFRAAQLRGANIDNTTGIDDFRRLNDMLAALDELDVRKDNVNRTRSIYDPATKKYIQVPDPLWRSDPTTGSKMPGTPARSALSDRSDAYLRARVSDGLRSPEVLKIVDEYRKINNALLDYGERTGIWSAREIADMRGKNPNYVHRMVTEMTLKRNERAGLNPLTSATERNSPLTERNRSEDAGPDRYQDAFMSMQDGIAQTLDFIRRNAAVREVARTLSENPNSPNLLGIGRILVDRPGVKHRDGYIPVQFRDDHGTRYILEMDPTISQSLLPYPRAFVPIANGARMLEQKLTTGPIGFILGNLQAPASAAMGAIAAAINAAPNLKLGIIDKWVTNSTGVSLRKYGVVDPTFFAQVLAAPIRDVWDMRGQVISNALQRSIDKDGLLATTANMLGPGRAQAMADAFKRSYEASDLHRMRREGLIAQGLAYAMESGSLTGFAANVRNLAQNSPEYAAAMNYDGFAKSITDIRTLEQFREYTATANAASGNIPGGAEVRRLWQSYSKFLDLIANAPQSAIYRANKGNLANEQGIIGQARSITGDPSQYGSYRMVQGLLSMVPYGNIMMQAGHQTLKAFKREPAAFAVRTAMLATMTSVAMIQSAIDADERAIAKGEAPQSVAHLLTRDSRDAAAAFRFYLDSSNPEASIRVPIEQSFAPFFSAVLASVAKGFDLENPEFFSQRYAPLRDSIHRLIEDGDDQRMRAAFGLAGGDIPMLGAADAASRILTGQSIENALSFATGARITPDRSSRSLDRQLLNNDVADRYTATILETATGFGGQSLLDLWRTFGIVNREKDTASALSATAKQYSLNVTGGARIVGPAMFGQERRQRSTDIVGEIIRESEQKLDTLTRNMGQLRGGEGSIGPSTRLREPEFGGGRAGVPADMQPLLLQLAKFNSQLSRMQQQRTDALEELRTLNGSPQLRADPARLRTETNRAAQNVREINSMIYQRILAVEADLSEETGRRIRISDIDPMQDMSQFPLIRGATQ